MSGETPHKGTGEKKEKKGTATMAPVIAELGPLPQPTNPLEEYAEFIHAIRHISSITERFFEKLNGEDQARITIETQALIHSMEEIYPNDKRVQLLKERLYEHDTMDTLIRMAWKYIYTRFLETVTPEEKIAIFMPIFSLSMGMSENADTALASVTKTIYDITQRMKVTEDL